MTSGALVPARGRSAQPALTWPVAPIVDEELVLRAWTIRDAPELARAWSDPVIAARLPVPDERHRDAAADWISGWESRRRSGAALDLVVADAAGDAVLGEVGFGRIDQERRAAVVGWWIAASARRAGIGARAVGLATGWALTEVGLAAVVAEIDSDNVASIRLAESVGFELGTAPGPAGRRVYVRRRPRPARSGGR
ncbi:MAG: GNAT family N-acetyltransferase [Acidimicrobiales bacterium]